MALDIPLLEYVPSYAVEVDKVSRTYYIYIYMYHKLGLQDD